MRLIGIRDEKPGDESAIRSVHRKAFGRDIEGDLIDKLRKGGALTVSLVASCGNRIVGHIAFSPVEIKSEHYSIPAVSLGPLAVSAGYQSNGIGSRLVGEGIKRCERLKYGAIVVVGDSGYYRRFGFIPAGQKHIECEFNVPDESWMLLELKAGMVDGIGGEVIYRPEFREAT